MGKRWYKADISKFPITPKNSDITLITELAIAVISYQNPKYPTIKNFEEEALKH